MLAQRQQRTALGLEIRRERLPFRTTDRTEEDRIGRLAGFHRVFGQRMSAIIEGRAADELFLERELDPETLGNFPEHLAGFGHHFGADAVSWQHRDLVGFTHGPRPKTGSPRPQAEM